MPSNLQAASDDVPPWSHEQPASRESGEPPQSATAGSVLFGWKPGEHLRQSAAAAAAAAVHPARATSTTRLTPWQSFTDVTKASSMSWLEVATKMAVEHRHERNI